MGELCGRHVCNCCGHRHGVVVCMSVWLYYHSIHHDVACVTVIAADSVLWLLIAVGMGTCVIAVAAPVFTNNILN